MASMSEEVGTFLRNTRFVEGRELDVAIVYAQSFAEELRSMSEEWVAVAARLRGMKRGGIGGFNEPSGPWTVTQ